VPFDKRDSFPEKIADGKIKKPQKIKPTAIEDVTCICDKFQT